jgi:cytochrome b
MKTIKVWDPFVRIFHWSLFLSIIFQFVTAEESTDLHVKCGFFIILLLLLRIIWGFIGSKHARFTNFVYPPKDILAYLTGLFKRNPKYYMGHNPAGGAMVVTLLVVLLLTATTGLKTYGAEGKGPLAHQTAGIISNAYADEEDHEESEYENDEHSNGSESAEGDEFWEEIHKFFADVLIFLAVLHITGVIVSSYMHKENLILAMITGKKKSPEPNTD